MYLDKICIRNTGPLDKIDITANFNGEYPKPIILVGENGSGKTTVLSNIVDAFYEIGKEYYINITNKNKNKPYGYDFYKKISPYDIKNDEEYTFTSIKFKERDSSDNIFEYFYLVKIGKLTVEEFIKENGHIGITNIYNEFNQKNKIINADRNIVRESFGKKIVGYFTSNRYEYPSWQGRSYYNNINYENFFTENNIDELYNQISISSVNKENLEWLISVIVDSRAGLDFNFLLTDNKLVLESKSDEYRQVLLGSLKTKSNIDDILSSIIGRRVKITLRNRSHVVNDRLCIKEEDSDKVLLNSINSLSTGENVLFNIFISILRFADNNNMASTIIPDKISGIVLIDEIDLHLNASLLRLKVPELLKIFPRVQFIITTHSPMFLLGMDDVYGKDGYDIYALPGGDKIDSEEFSEFQKSLEFISSTSYFEEIKNKILSDDSNKILIITEGPSDWKHMKAAYKNLMSDVSFKEMYKNINFEFFEYEAANFQGECILKSDMGIEDLAAMCRGFSKIKHSKKMIFISDADKENKYFKINNNNLYKSHGNNVFSFILPVPSTRNKTPNICIEHLYSDDEIKTNFEVNGIKRRLYIGNEFDEDGFSDDMKFFCNVKNSCGKNKINIIDGNGKNKVYMTSDKSKANLALTKNKFASYVLENHENCKEFKFTNFKKIFEIISLINKEPFI